MADLTEIKNLLHNIPKEGDQAILRFVLVPDRNEEVIDPLDLGLPTFVERVYEIAHRSTVGLLNFRHPKRDEVGARALTIIQESSENWRAGMENVRLEIRSTGMIILDGNVSGRHQRTSSDGMMDMFVLAEEDVQTVLNGDFRFAGALFDELDKFLRHQRFFYNIAIASVGYRKLERNPQPRKSFGMGTRNDDGPLVVFDEPRVVVRASLSTPADEVRRSLTMLARHPDIR